MKKKVTTTKTTVTSLEIKGLAVDYNKYIRLSHFEIIFLMNKSNRGKSGSDFWTSTEDLGPRKINKIKASTS